MKTIIIPILIAALYAPNLKEGKRYKIHQDLWPHMPAYTWQYADRFKVPYWLMERVSFVESSHRPSVGSHMDCWGRYQVSKIHLEYYADMTGAHVRGAWRKFLTNDKHNSWIFAWTVDWWSRRGISHERIMQYWLFGRYAVEVDGRWSDSYSNKIFN